MINKYNHHPGTLTAIFLILLLITSIPAFTQSKNSTKDSIAEFLKKDRNDLNARELLRLSQHYFHKDSLLLCNEYVNDGIRKALEKENQNYLAELYMQKGYVYLYWGGYDNALDFFTKVADLGAELNDTNIIIGGYHGKGRTYTGLKEYEAALKELEAGLEVVNAIGSRLDSFRGFSSKRTVAIFNNAMGIAYQGLEKYHKAIQHFDVNERIAREIGDSLTEIFAIINKGNVYLLLDNYIRAEQCFNDAIEKNKISQSAYANAAIYGNLGNLSFKRGEFEKSIEYSLQSMQISKRNRFSSYLVETYNILHEDYIELGNFEEALKYYKLYKELEDSIFNSEKLQDLNLLKIRHKAESREAEAVILEQKVKSRTMLMYLSIILAAFFITTLILLYSRYQLSKRLHKEEKEELNLTIDENNRKLVAQLMQKSMKHEILEEADEIMNLIDVSKEKEELKVKLGKFKSTLEQSVKVEDDWEKTKFHFEKVHPDFFKRLKQMYPDLSTNDLKICAYTKVNLSTKDIAKLMNISFRSVQTARYRIKKKMKLEKETDFTDHIRTV